MSKTWGKSWARIVLESFLEESGIIQRVAIGDEKAKILEGIMRTRFAGWTITKQAEEFNISVDTVNNYIKELKDLYDQTEKHSLILPPRKTKSRELDINKL